MCDEGRRLRFLPSGMTVGEAGKEEAAGEVRSGSSSKLIPLAEAGQ